MSPLFKMSITAVTPDSVFMRVEWCNSGKCLAGCLEPCRWLKDGNDFPLGDTWGSPPPTSEAKRVPWVTQQRCFGQLSRTRVFSNKGPWQKINQSPRISSHRLQIEAAAGGPRLAFTCPACKGTPGDKLIFTVTPTQAQQSLTESTLHRKEPFLVEYSKLPGNTDGVEIEHGEFRD